MYFEIREQQTCPRMEVARPIWSEYFSLVYFCAESTFLISKGDSSSAIYVIARANGGGRGRRRWFVAPKIEQTGSNGPRMNGDWSKRIVKERQLRECELMSTIQFSQY